MKSHTRGYHTFLQIIKIILYLCPLCLGWIGLAVMEKVSILESLYSSVNMYLLNYGDTPPNILVEIARWTAPLVTASGIITVLYTVRQKLRHFMTYLHGNSVAVYGEDTLQQELLRQLGKQGIRGEEDFIRAEKYMLVGTESENLAFYNQHKEQMAEHKIYIKCSSLQAQYAPAANVVLFSEEESAARTYWKKYPLFQQAAEHAYQLSIVFIGFGKLGEELLTHGLQTNIFHPSQQLNYHIFDSSDEFLNIHSMIASVEDNILFDQDAWHQHTDLLEAADLILVLEQTDQTKLLSDLLFATLNEHICIFHGDDCLDDFIPEKHRVCFYDWHTEGLSIANIMGESQLQKAKDINYRYACLYQDENDTTVLDRNEIWKSLDTFTRYSNISSADYHEMRLHIMDSLHIPTTINEITADQLELLSELEHIRWCRYHYLNNWRYGTPENGKRKDSSKRIHADLVPYAELTDGEKEKDRENIRVLLS